MANKVNFSKNDMKILISHLYYSDDIFYLERKYNKIKHYLGFAT